MVFEIVLLALSILLDTLGYPLPYFGLSAPQPTLPTLSNTPAWTIQTLHLPQPRFFDRCPPMAPIQLRHYPLASLGLDHSVAVVGPHGFVPISSDRLDCTFPPRRPQPTSAPAPSVEALKQPTDATRRAFLSLVKHWRPEPWACVIGVVITLLIAVIITLCIKLRKLSARHDHSLDLHAQTLDWRAQTRDTEKDLRETIDGLFALTETTLKTTEALIASNRGTTASRDQARRLAEYFEDMATDLVQELAVIQPQNLVWAAMVQNGFLVPEHVIYIPPPPAVAPAAVEVAVDPPPIL